MTVWHSWFLIPTAWQIGSFYYTVMFFLSKKKTHKVIIVLRHILSFIMTDQVWSLLLWKQTHYSSFYTMTIKCVLYIYLHFWEIVCLDKERKINQLQSLTLVTMTSCFFLHINALLTVDSLQFIDLFPAYVRSTTTTIPTPTCKEEYINYCEYL